MFERAGTGGGGFVDATGDRFGIADKRDMSSFLFDSNCGGNLPLAMCK